MAQLKRPSFSHNYKKHCTNTEQNRRGHDRPSRFLACNRQSTWSKRALGCDVYGDEGRLISLLHAVFYIRVETNLPGSINLSLPSRPSPHGLHLSSLAYAPFFSPSLLFLLLTQRAYHVVLTTASQKHMTISQRDHNFSNVIEKSSDAVRHAFAIGFIALLICGIAPRMLPGFSGGKIVSPSLVSATLWLGNAAAALRVGSLLFTPLFAGTQGFAIDNFLFSLSGPCGLALAICLVINLWSTLRSSSRHVVRGGGRGKADGHPCGQYRYNTMHGRRKNIPLVVDA